MGVGAGLNHKGTKEQRGQPRIHTNAHEGRLWISGGPERGDGCGGVAGKLIAGTGERGSIDGENAEVPNRCEMSQ
jgi:hypothetical protein